jgi:hypothetical protein
MNSRVLKSGRSSVSGRRRLTDVPDLDTPIQPIVLGLVYFVIQCSRVSLRVKPEDDRIYIAPICSKCRVSLVEAPHPIEIKTVKISKNPGSHFRRALKPCTCFKISAPHIPEGGGGLVTR